MANTFSNKKIEEISIRLVMDYLASKGERPNEGKKGEGADVISGNKYIDVKGCLKKGTNIRMAQQALDSISESGKLKQGSFFIYYVYNIASAPNLMIFDYETFKKHKMAEIKWVMQPSKIKKETGKPTIIPLPNKKMSS